MNTVVEIRRCPRCSARLSRSNPDRLCGPCRRAVGPDDRRAARLAAVAPLPAEEPTAEEAGPDLGGILRKFRAETRLTQQDLSDLLGFSQPYVSLLERGKRTIRDVTQLRRVARLLGLPETAVGLLPLAA
ncbi:helix-turn-helix transcriptional regulator [Kitasatospora sp. NPDC093102]|uniref:helix-turn-helix domain-containing protein n=1 Tax=Kitasatospora sp. NPDC093102 TaxID=3155069 RepID=UPI00341DACEB